MARRSYWSATGIRGDTAGITRLKSARAEVNVYDAFVGDTIQTGNLTVNLGARFDYQQGKNLPSSVPANPIFPEILPAGSIRRRLRVSHHLAPVPAAGRGDVRSWRRSHAAARLVCPIRQPAEQRHGRRASTRFPTSRPRTTSGTTSTGTVESNRARSISSQPAGFRRRPGNPASSRRSIESPRTSRRRRPTKSSSAIERQIASNLSGSLAYTYRVSRNLEFSPLIGTTRAELRLLRQRGGDCRG